LRVQEGRSFFGLHRVAQPRPSKKMGGAVILRLSVFPRPASSFAARCGVRAPLTDAARGYASRRASSVGTPARPASSTAPHRDDAAMHTPHSDRPPRSYAAGLVPVAPAVARAGRGAHARRRDRHPRARRHDRVIRPSSSLCSGAMPALARCTPSPLLPREMDTLDTACRTHISPCFAIQRAATADRRPFLCSVPSEHRSMSLAAVCAPSLFWVAIDCATVAFDAETRITRAHCSSTGPNHCTKSARRRHTMSSACRPPCGWMIATGN